MTAEAFIVFMFFYVAFIEFPNHNNCLTAHMNYFVGQQWCYVKPKS